MAIQTRFDEEKTYGVEIEFAGLTNTQVQNLARALTAAGLPTECEGYNHTTRRHWKIIYDGSVRNNAYHQGWELVSPILKGRQGLKDIETACQVLKEHNAKVNRSCGLHVHHDASNWGVDEWLNINRLYARMEPTIDAAMPQSRRESNNHFCRSMRNQILGNLDTFNNFKTLEDLRNWTGWEGERRYRKVNMESWWRHKTVEFRQHSGTIECDKIVNWVVFTQLLAKKAEGRKVKLVLKEKRYQNVTPLRAVSIEFNLHGKKEDMDDLVYNAIHWMAKRISHFGTLSNAA